MSSGRMWLDLFLSGLLDGLNQHFPNTFLLFQLETKTTFFKKMLAIFGFHSENIFSEKNSYKKPAIMNHFIVLFTYY